MSGCPIRPVRHIYKNRGLVTNYSTTGGICKICPPSAPPRPSANISFALHSDVPYSVTFIVGGGNGTYDLGDGVLHPFFGSDGYATIHGIVPVGATVLIYGSIINLFGTSDQPVSFLDVTNCSTLQILNCNQFSPGQSYLTGSFDLSSNPLLTQVQFLNTLISELTGVTSCPGLINVIVSGDAFTQTTSDELVNFLITNGASNGYLSIVNQSDGTIDITGFLYNTLIDTFNWNIV
uniref:Uncharacterized protein n=1 Tax=viral metagenome TaxID=1070528 RepID=A0A6C0CFG7_9ZZZZ